MTVSPAYESCRRGRRDGRAEAESRAEAGAGDPAKRESGAASRSDEVRVTGVCGKNTPSR